MLCSSEGPLPRNASTAACDSQRSNMSIRPAHQIRGDGEVEAAACEAGLSHDAHAVRKVGLALLRIDDDMPRDDYHVLSLR